MRIFTDAGSRGNPGPSAYAVVICSDSGAKIGEISRYIGEGTNNEAEYQGMLAAVKEAKALKADEVVLTSDSELMVRQINRQYRVKAENLRPMVEEIWRLMSSFERAEVRHANRNHPMIQRADELVNQELDDMELARSLRS